jgi:hypothetical protein
MFPHQSWILANTLSDLLIASAMFHHVNSNRLLYMGSFKTDTSIPDPSVEKNLGQGRQPQQSCPCEDRETDIGDQFGDE